MIPATSAAASGRDAMTFAVLPVEATNPALATAATSELSEQIGRTHRFRMVEGERIADVLRTIAKSQQRDYDSALEAGRLLAARYVCFGSLDTWMAETPLEHHVRLMAYARLRVRVVQVETDVVLFDENSTEMELGWANETPIEALYASAVTSATKELVRRFENTFRLEGTVLQMDGKRVLIDLGRLHGLEKGATLELLRVGATVQHPETGEALTAPEIHLGEVKVVDAGDRTSWAELSGGKAAKVGDHVRSQPKKKSTWEW